VLEISIKCHQFILISVAGISTLKDKLSNQKLSLQIITWFFSLLCFFLSLHLLLFALASVILDVKPIWQLLTTLCLVFLYSHTDAIMGLALHASCLARLHYPAVTVVRKGMF
jgi:hypothetical protein